MDDDFEDLLFTSSQETSVDSVFDEDVLLAETGDLMETPMSQDTEHFPWSLSSGPQSNGFSDELRLDEPAPTQESYRFFEADEESGSLDETPPHLRDRHWVIARIEAIFERIVDGLSESRKHLVITLRTRPRRSGKAPKEIEAKKRDIRFPGGTPREAWKFTVLVRILELVHGALVDNITISKRDIYYRHVDLFVKQVVVDRYVDDIAFTFGVSRTLLNVAAASKGLVAGAFKIQRHDGTEFNALAEREGMLIPRFQDSDALDMRQVRWILIIEKEATFRSLLASPFWLTISAQGLAMTAKGYPDLASRIFLGHVTIQSPEIPVYALMDFDPDGIAILSTYKYGSSALAHETLHMAHGAGHAPRLTLPQLQWLGVRSCHIFGHVSPGDGRIDASSTTAQGVMRLSGRDRHKACRMLEWDICADDGSELEWRRELQTMLMLNIKAELQVFEERPGGLGFWLQSQVSKAEA